jgi:hypothetical protein
MLTMIKQLYRNDYLNVLLKKRKQKNIKQKDYKKKKPTRFWFIRYLKYKKFKKTRDIFKRKILGNLNLNLIFKNILLHYYINFFFKIKNIMYSNRKIKNNSVGFLAIKINKNNIFGLLSNKNFKLKYWCTPSSLKLLRKKKTKKFNFDMILTQLKNQISFLKYSKIHLQFFGKRILILKKLKILLADTAKSFKILSIKRSLKIVFNGCKLSKKRRKRKRLKFSFSFKGRLPLHKKL